MKSALSFALIILLNLVSFSSRADVLGPVNFKFIGTYQDIFGQSSNTVHATATVTNTELILTATTTNAALNNDKLLRMLANSFNTTFPSGGELNFDQAQHLVVVVGTNIILNVSNVLVLNHDFTNGVLVNHAVLAEEVSPHGTISNSHAKGIGTTEASLDYDDSLLPTADGNTTRFSVKGLLTSHNSSVVKKGVGSDVSILTFSGSGSGSISNAVSHRTFILRGGFVSRITIHIPRDLGHLGDSLGD
jgi:hypothetical protein